MLVWIKFKEDAEPVKVYRRASSFSEPLEVIKPNPKMAYEVYERTLDGNDVLWYRIGQDKWVQDNSCFKTIKPAKPNPALCDTLKNYKIIYRLNDKEFAAFKQNPPYSDDTDVDIYTLYAYDKLNIPTGAWAIVEELLNAE